jgi:hypothetical protein
MRRRYTEAPTGVFTPMNTKDPRFIMHNGILFINRPVTNIFTYSSYKEHAAEIVDNADTVINIDVNLFLELWYKAKHAENIPEAFAAAVAMALMEGRLEGPQ